MGKQCNWFTVCPNIYYCHKLNIVFNCHGFPLWVVWTNCCFRFSDRIQVVWNTAYWFIILWGRVLLPWKAIIILYSFFMTARLTRAFRIQSKPPSVCASGAILKLDDKSDNSSLIERRMGFVVLCEPGSICSWQRHQGKSYLRTWCCSRMVYSSGCGDIRSTVLIPQESCTSFDMTQDAKTCIIYKMKIRAPKKRPICLQFLWFSETTFFCN